MISLTSDRAVMDLGGRRATAKVAISGTVPDVRGLPVFVTLYRGKIIHIEGYHLKIDTDGAPSTNHSNFLNLGMFFVIGGAILVGVNVLIGSLMRPRDLPR
jgi:hypothetical protein